VYLHNHWIKSHKLKTVRKPRRSTLLYLCNAKRNVHPVKRYIANNLKLPNIAMLSEPTVHTILLQNVLHVPITCINLVSGIQLDKAGVQSSLKNGSITLAANGRIIIYGKIMNDMYCLDLKIVTPNNASLAS
jgi:hypothetical protein